MCLHLAVNVWEKRKWTIKMLIAVVMMRIHCWLRGGGIQGKCSATVSLFLSINNKR